MAAPRDTAPDAWARYLQAVRALTPDERVRLATSMSDELRDLTRSGIRARHPDWADDAVARSLADIVLGAALAAAVRAAGRVSPT
ncbi:MAG TPA: hypothetical protein VFK35_00280 [Candidatus Limnocylindrales bacterium]|nr:hypothetical protein [Candidatus Limnocylindrales bacterium]